MVTYVTGLGLAQDWHVQCQCPVIWCQSSVIPIIWVGCSWLACLGADQWWIGISSCNLVIGRAFVVWHWISIAWLRCGTGSGLVQKPHWHWIGQGSASGWISTGNQLEAGCWPLVWWSLDWGEKDTRLALYESKAHWSTCNWPGIDMRHDNFQPWARCFCVDIILCWDQLSIQRRLCFRLLGIGSELALESPFVEKGMASDWAGIGNGLCWTSAWKLPSEETLCHFLGFVYLSTFRRHNSNWHRIGKDWQKVWHWHRIGKKGRRMHCRAALGMLCQIVETLRTIHTEDLFYG